MSHRFLPRSLGEAPARTARARAPRARLLCALWAVAAVGLTAPRAHAQTGVSDDRVSLPDGPGSIDGIGDNVSVNGNMGAMAYTVPIEVPAGHGGMSPDLTLRYSSMGGSSVVGVGWSLMVPSIERLTLRGLPEYDRDDEMAADGSSQLVRVATTMTTATYRARFEREFVRYTWHAVGSGRAGYWTAEYPDGRVGYFGADADGTLVEDARLEQGGNTFRWMLVEVVDSFDHRLRYEYDASSGSPTLTSVHWVHDAGGTPRYLAQLDYEARPDPISDASPGFEERVTTRLAGIRVRARGEVIRSYRLTYESASTSGGVSRLARVERFGREGGLYPVVSSFGYSRSITGVCGSEMCDAPFVADMGSVPGASGLSRGDSTLIDIDGDALPDLLDTSLERHRFYLNRLDSEGQGHFEPTPVESTIGRRTPFALSQASVQVLDVNGDGFADLIDTLGGSFLCNLGHGDWVGPSDPEASRCGAVGTDGVTLEADDVGGAGDPDPLRTRFVDLDGDRRIDILRTDSTSDTRAWLNTASGFRELTGIEALGAQFDGDNVQLADMNGDGLLDVVRIDDTGTVRYRLSLGRGRFSRDGADRAFSVATAPALGSSTAIELVQLEDLNGDGLDDLVLVEGSTVSIAINRNAGRFDPFRVLDASVVTDLPTRTPTTTVLFADMNGNGSRDVVWVEQSGRVRYLEMFPVRPNLLSRIENGIGMVWDVTYGRSVQHRAGAETPWAYPLTMPMTVVDRTDTFVTLTGSDSGGLHEVIEYAYRDGFYDGVEKAFRGFGEMEQRTVADVERDGQEPSRIVQTYDLGVNDPYRAGLTLTRRTFSGAPERALREERHTHEDCEVAGVGTGTLFPVRFVCETGNLTIHQEGAPSEEWATTRSETRYDGYGNATLSTEHGVVHMGPPEAPRACGVCTSSEPDRFGGPCGDTCLGDEMYSERAFIEPGSATGDHWILGAPYLERGYAVPGGPASETRTYYDGPDFVGLAEGRLSHGTPTRSVRRVSDGEEIEQGRAALDAHGNIVVSLDPLGSPDDTSGHRRAYTYDDDGLQVLRTEIFLTSPEGVPYRLRQEYGYEPALDLPIESSGWMIDGLGAGSGRNPTYYAYDEHARIVATALPGDTLAAPSTQVAYELGEPVSRIVISQRSTSGEAPDVIAARCLDGRGRVFQELRRVREGEWLATGFVAVNRGGNPVQVYQPYTVASGACATAPPADVRHVDVVYDGLGRQLERRVPDAELYGARSELRNEHLPLAVRSFDEEDLDPASPHADTPGITRFDGLGRPIAMERILRTQTGLEPQRMSVVYDGRGNVAGYFDPLGHEKRQRFDLAGRLVEIDDPNTGTTTIEYDAVGLAVRTTDALGRTTRVEYDGANRAIARYDADDPEGTRITLRYDAAPGCPSCVNGENHLVEATYPLPAAIGARIGGNVGADRLGYDGRGRPVLQERRMGAQSFVFETVLDGVDRPLRTDYPDGQTLVRRYDGAGRLVSIDGVVERIEYDERGQMARVARADGGEETVDYDVVMRFARMTTVAGSGEVLQDAIFTRDRRGQLVELQDAASGPSGFEPGARRLTYDSLQRLQSAELSVGLEHEEVLTYEHDAIDNLLRATSSLGAASAGNVGDLRYETERPSVARQVGGISQSHDAAGFLTERDGAELGWDYLGRLTEVRRGGELEGVFAYGFDHHRVAKLEDGSLTLYLSAELEVRDGVSRLYARLGSDRIARLQSTALSAAIYDDPDGDGEITAADLLTADDSMREALAHAAARRLLHEAAPEPVQLYEDHLGNAIAATRRGEVTGRAAYYPFGEIRAQSGFVDEHGFTGQERDSSTGLIAFEHRYLDSYGGQWASADPAFAATGDLQAHASEHFARYAYVRGDPANLVDPRGLLYGNTVAAPANTNQFHVLLDWVTNFADFSTPHNGAVFWMHPNGGNINNGQGGGEAQHWATDMTARNAQPGGNGQAYMTLEQTPGFVNHLQNLNLGNFTQQQIGQLFDAVSYRFASSATGDVHVFRNAATNHGQRLQGAGQGVPLRTFPRLELPRLLGNVNVTSIIDHARYVQNSAVHTGAVTAVQNLRALRNTMRAIAGGAAAAARARGLCASPDSPIATPLGDRPIAELVPGDLVYSLHQGQLVAVPLAEVSRTPVSDHRVVRLVLEGGAVIEMSEGHPTADGRLLGELSAGDLVDGVPVVAIELIPYLHSHTYDILPDSDSGTYVASGVLMGSTLAP